MAEARIAPNKVLTDVFIKCVRLSLNQLVCIDLLQYITVYSVSLRFRNFTTWSEHYAKDSVYSQAKIIRLENKTTLILRFGWPCNLFQQPRRVDQNFAASCLTHVRLDQIIMGDILRRYSNSLQCSDIK